MATVTLTPDGGATAGDNDSHAALSATNDTYDDSQLTLSRSGDQLSEVHARYLMPMIVPGSRINSATFRVRHKGVAGYAQTSMRLAVAKHKHFLLDPAYVDGHFIAHKLMDVRTFDSGANAAGNAARDAGAATLLVHSTNKVGGQKTHQQEFTSNGNDIKTIEFFGTRGNSRTSETVWVEIYSVDASGPEIKRGDLLGTTATIDYNSMPTGFGFAWITFTMATAITGLTNGQRLLACPMVSFQDTTTNSQVRFWGGSAEIDVDASTPAGLLFSTVGDGYSAQGAYHYQHMMEQRDYPHLNLAASDTVRDEVLYAGEFGWSSNGTVNTNPASGGFPVTDQWYEVGDPDIDLCAQIQTYIDDDAFSADTPGLGVIFSRNGAANPVALTLDYYSTESGSPPELVIDYDVPIGVRFQGVEVGTSVQASVEAGPAVSASVEAGSAVQANVEAGAAVSATASAGTSVHASVDTGERT